MVQQLSYWKVLTRRKQLSQESAEGESKFNRVLGLYDLTALGVGSTLGAGVYVLAGQIAKDQAGPSVLLSFAIAALASLLAGVCYAEFGARVPKAGSAYVYSYVCIGEFAAFVIGWNLILEYMIGTASVCRGISLYLDTLINDTLKTTFAELVPLNISFLGSYFDFFAFGLVVVFGVVLAFGVETSAIVNNFCTCLNLFILVFVIIAGSLKANFSNWTIDVNAVNITDIPPDAELGNGGFFPFGFTGTLKGAATCFFGFVGFDCIATTGEEVQNPRKNIPRSILLSLLVIFLCYFGVSTVITLMVPYYLQDANAPLPSAFRIVGWNFAMWIVSIGGLVGLLASLFGALFPLPRVMYSMAQDGLMFRVFAQIHPRYRVPVIGSIVAAVLTAFIAGLFDLAQLVNLLSIGTLLAYSVVAISITILRYMDNEETFGKTQPSCNIDGVTGDNGHVNDNVNGNGNHRNIDNANGHNVSESSLLTSKGERVSFKVVFMQLFNFERKYTPNELSTKIVGSLITVFCILSAGIGLIFMQAYDALINNQTWVLILMIVLCLLATVVLLCICLQPRELCIKVFTVPLVPFVPATSIFINIYLMLQLDVMTWIRFGVWMAIGIPMFVACWCMYDIKNPANRHPDRIEFGRLLKLSTTPFPKSSESCKHFEKDLNTLTSTLIAQQNESSVKSLDDIMDLNEVGNGLMEIKHPNGQICYIEETKSCNSQTSLEKTKEDNKCNNAPFKTDPSEEENSAIAFLDNILETEDNYNRNSYFLQLNNRKTSTDSEMLPIVIRSITVATVHRSSKSDYSDNWIKSSASSNSYGNVTYEEKQKVSKELVDDILNSEELCLALDTHYQKVIETEISNKPLNYTKCKNEKQLNPLNRMQSIESILPINSVENPLRSEKFRNKLNMLIIKQPKPNYIKDSYRTVNPVQEMFPKLKHSKSEAYIKELVLKSKESCNTDTDDGNKDNAYINDKGQIIPKPPKFDPILYKTVNSICKTSESIRQDILLQKGNLNTNHKTFEKKIEPQRNDLPFKQKLEAILKRGPFHRTQT